MGEEIIQRQKLLRKWESVWASMIGVCWGPTTHNCAGCTFSVQAASSLTIRITITQLRAQLMLGMLGGAAQEEGVAGAQVPFGVPPAQLGILGCTGLQASRETRSGSGGEAHHPPEAQGLNTSVTCHLLFISVSDISYIITDHIFSLVSLTVSILWKGCRRSRCAVSTCLQIQTPTRPSSQYKDFVVFLIKNQLYFSTVTGCIYPRYQGERRQCYFQGSFGWFGKCWFVGCRHILTGGHFVRRPSALLSILHSTLMGGHLIDFVWEHLIQ